MPALAPDARGLPSAAACAGSPRWPPSAVREAENGEEFVERVRRRAGHPAPDHRRRDRGRALLALGGAPLPAWIGARTIVADIGGGSLELIGAVDGLVELDHVAAARRGAAHRDAPRSRARTPPQEVAAAAGQGPEAAAEGLAAGGNGTTRGLIGSGGTFTNLGSHGARAAAACPMPDSVHGDDRRDRARWSSCWSGSAP